MLYPYSCNMTEPDDKPDPRLPAVPPEESTVVVEHRIRRINWTLVSDAVLGTFNAERGFVFTTRAFLLNPRHAFEDYIGGNRMRYSNPLKMVIFLSAVAAFAMHHLLASEVIQIAEGVERTAEQDAAAAFTRRNYNLLLLCSLPFMALVSRLFYWKRAYNWLEHLALNSFQVSIITVAYLISLPTMLFAPVITTLVYLVLVLAYQAWFYRQILGPGWFRAIVATLSVTMAYFIAMTIIGSIWLSLIS